MKMQEEIRDGILKRLNEFRCDLQKSDALINTDTLVSLQGAFADQILKDESELGVVLKVVCSRCKGNRWVSITEINGSSGGMHNETCPECGGLGFTVESLI